MDYYRSLSHKLHTALGLERREWGIFIQAWFWLLGFDLLLRTRPYPRVQQWVDGKGKEQQAVPSVQAWEIIRRSQRFVLLAARYHLYRMTCLRQALTLKRMLGVKGIPTELRFGARKTGGQFLAHAWLEYEGQSIELTHTSESFKALKPLGQQP
jgi:hypothetical protein